MISISVTSYNGAATAPLSGHFDETGGNIGRGENNQLVLPDPERTISRVHAQVVFRNGRYAIIDRGSNPISVNGRPLGNGQEAFIQPGDELQIGGYAMRVEAAAATGGAAAADPFADFPGLASTPAAAGARAPHRPRPSPIRSPASARRAAAAASGPAARPPAYAPPRRRRRRRAAGGIPQDWDPFAPDPKTARRKATTSPARSASPRRRRRRQLRPRRRRPRRGLDPGVRPRWRRRGGGGGGDSLDALFGLGASSGGRNIDPLAGSALEPGGGAAQHGGACRPDEVAQQHDARQRDGGERHDAGAVDAVHGAADDSGAGAASAAGRPPPRAAPPAPPRGRRSRRPRPTPRASSASRVPRVRRCSAARRSRAAPEAAAPPGAVLSWNDPSGESQTVIRPRGGAPAPGGAAIPTTCSTSRSISARPRRPRRSRPPSVRRRSWRRRRQPPAAAPPPVPVPPPVAARPQAPPPVRTTAGAPAWQPPPNAAGAAAGARVRRRRPTPTSPR